MKKILFVVLATAAVQSSFSQANPIPNPGFENWTGTSLNNWYALSVAGCTKSTTAHSGSFALKMAPWGGAAYGANAYVPSNGGFPLNGLNPTSLDGWYTGNFANGDQVQVTVSVYSGGTTTGTGYALITTTAAVYTPFSVSIFNGASTADSARIQFTEITSSHSSIGLNAATYIILDDLQLTGTLGIASGKNELQLNVFPNPSTGTFTISAGSELGANAKFTIISAYGKEVMTSAAGKLYTNGLYQLDLSACEAGVYFVCARSGEAVETKRVVVLK